ncbi:host attachment protein [Acidimangrovimonas pyrenivorans]|uniref:Host attachment protein n=1 Tax=Acidimangrovimonas pyrenivorans TaxID=2030798 RepID=A0ABV7AFJ3_9RHOB
MTARAGGSRLPATDLLQEGRMKPVRTMIVLANEKRFRLLMNEGVGKGLTEIEDRGREEFPEVETEFSDRPGRNTASDGGSRHGFQPHETEREQIRDRFAARLVEEIAAAFDGEGADQLVIAAAPRMLGELRADLSEALRSKISAELDKDLLKIPLTELEAHLKDVLAV